MGNPKVTVVFPVYNTGKFIREAIQSILDQTFADFEFLIIDDGSTDDSVKKIIQFEDPRIRLLHNEKNEGLIFTLNRGIAEAKGDLIARMDADDISYPDRFEKQVSYLEAHPDVGVCGTLMKMIHNGKIYKHRFLESDLIKSAFVFTNPLVHPSVMMRKNLFKQGEPVYNKEFLHGEDYALWLSLLPKTGFHIIGSPLIEYRAHTDQVSRKFNSIQRAAVKKAQEMIFAYLGIQASEEEKGIHLSLFLELYQKNAAYLQAVEKWLQKLSVANEKIKFFDTVSFKNCIGEWWYRVNQELSTSGFGGIKEFRQSSLSGFYKPSTKSIAKLRVKSILKTSRKN